MSQVHRSGGILLTVQEMGTLIIGNIATTTMATATTTATSQGQTDIDLVTKTLDMVTNGEHEKTRTTVMDLGSINHSTKSSSASTPTLHRSELGRCNCTRT